MNWYAATLGAAGAFALAGILGGVFMPQASGLDVLLTMTVAIVIGGLAGGRLA